MKTQIITFSFLIAALTVTSCKNSETAVPETPVTTAPSVVDTTMQKPAPTVKDTVKTTEKNEKGENEANEKE